MNEQWWVGALGGGNRRASGGQGHLLDLGPQHPTRAGLVGLNLDFDDAIVVRARIQPGYLHRGAEKLFEVRDYRQGLMLADRHDWQSPFAGELVAALACEQALGLSAPPRAVWLRTLLAEMARIASHLGFLTIVAHLAGDRELAADVRRVRQRGRELTLALSGNRLHPMLNRLGGLAADVTAPWLEDLSQWLDLVTELPLSQAVSALQLPAGLGTISGSQVEQFGLSGSVGRASGHENDLRTMPGYLAYGELDWSEMALIDPPAAGDAWARFHRWALEVLQSATLARQCVQRLASVGGPVNVKLARIIKLPDSETWLSIEAPLGIAGIHVVSRGGTTPWRFALRTPTFANVQALEVALLGTPREHLATVVGSLGWTIGDLDK